VAPCTRKYAGGLHANENGGNYVYAHVYSIQLKRGIDPLIGC